jgi:hypothetical protein
MSRTLTTGVPKSRNAKCRCDVHLTLFRSIGSKFWLSGFRISGVGGFKCRNTSPQETRSRKMRNVKIRETTTFWSFRYRELEE